MRISLVAGLPGSGKTTLLGEWAAQGAVVIDDIASLDALPRSPVPWLAVADVNFCRAHVREAAAADFALRYPGASVEWAFFANDPEACLANAERRDDGRNVRPDIAALTRDYVIPEGAEEIPVHRPGGPAPG